MKTKVEFEGTIKDTITMYKEIIFSSDTPNCMACLDEQQTLISMCMIKS